MIRLRDRRSPALPHTIRAEVEIDASVARVWEILVDLYAYA